MKQPVILHWLGEMFDPALKGYWGSDDHMAAMDVCVDLINSHPEKVDGIKISLLSAEKEIAMRRRLAQGVRMYTGDDFNYAELIAGDEAGYSDALLGIFDAIAPAASAALTRLGAGDVDGFSRHPGAHGAAVAAYLQGADAVLQDGRGVPGLSEWVAGSFCDAGRAAERALAGPPGRAVPAGGCVRMPARSGHWR